MYDIETIYKRSPMVVAATVSGTSFLLHIEDWVYLELNESGSGIWALLEDDRNVDQIVEDLSRSFRVDREVCVKDTLEFLATLEEKHFAIRE
jgi:hypothetical protein